MIPTVSTPGSPNLTLDASTAELRAALEPGFSFQKVGARLRRMFLMFWDGHTERQLAELLAAYLAHMDGLPEWAILEAIAKAEREWTRRPPPAVIVKNAAGLVNRLHGELARRQRIERQLAARDSDRRPASPEARRRILEDAGFRQIAETIARA